MFTVSLEPDYIQLEIPMLMISSELYKTSVISFHHCSTEVGVKTIDCPGINDILLERESATIVMQFPLRDPFTCIVRSKVGKISKKKIIDHIRSAYRQQYRMIRNANDEQSGIVISHPLKNLFIDSVFYSKNTNTIVARIDGIESIIDNYPF